MLENFLLFPSSHLFTGLFGAILMAYVLFYMLAIRQKPAAHWNLIGFYGGQLLFYLCMFVKNSNPLYFGVLSPFEDTFVLISAVGLIRFAYRFPEHDQPREARWMSAAFAAPAIFALGYSCRYAYGWFTTPKPPKIAPFFWLLAPAITLFALGVFWRRTVHYAQAEHSGRAWRNAWRLILTRPQNPAARVHRHFAFAACIVLGAMPFVVADSFPQLFPIKTIYLNYGFSVAMLLSVATIAFVYFNNAPHALTFLVKLVGIALVTLFAFAGVFAIELTTFIAAGRQAELNLLVQMTKHAALYKDFMTLPPEIQYIVSRHAKIPPDDTRYHLEFGDIEYFKGWGVKRSSLHETPWQNHIRFFLHNREYQAGIDSQPSNRKAQQKMIRLVVLCLFGSFAMIFGFPLFFRRILIRPLKNLLSGVEQLQHEQAPAAIPIERDDELGALTAAFNRMTISLHQAEQERIRLTAELAQNDLFYFLFEAHSAVMLLINPDTGKIERANASASRYYGYTLEALQTMSVYQLNQGDPAKINDAMRQAKLAQRNDFEFQHRLASGEIREVEVHSTVIAWRQQALLFSIIHDITARKEAETALRESEAQYRLLAENSRDVIWLMNPAGQFTYVSPSVEKLRGYTPQEVIQQTPEQVLTPESLNIVQTAMANVAMKIAQGIRLAQTEPVELEQPCKDGSTVWTEALVQPIFDERGQFSGFLGVTRNIAKRRQAEQALREREALLNAVGEIARIGGWELDVKTMLVTWTQETYRIHEIAESDSVPFAEALSFYHPADRPALEMALQRAMREGEAFDAEFRFMTAKGKRLWVRAIGRPVRVDGRIERLIGVFQDITDRKQAEAALRRSEEKFRQFFAQMPEYAYMISPDRLILDINDAALRMLGYAREELVGQPISIIYAPESLPKIAQLFAQWQGTGHLENEEVEIITRTRETRTVLLNAEAVCDDEGHILHSVSVQTDITMRKQAEDALRASEQQLRLIVEASPLPLFLALTTGDILVVNQAFCELFGCSREDALACSPSNFYAMPERDIPRIITALHAKQPIREWEVPARKSDGTLFDTLLSCEVIDYIGQPAVLAVVYDLTERKRTEAAVRETAQRLALAQAAGQIGIWDWNVKQNRLIWDARMFTIYGITPERFWNAYDAWKQCVHREDAELADAEVQTAIRNHHPFHAEFRIVWPNGQIRHIEAHAIVMYSAEGDAERMIGVNTDITERKELEAELIRAKDAAEHAERVKSTFFANVSHHLRTPLNVVLGFSELMSNDKTLSATYQEYLALIRQNGKDLLALINQMLTVSKLPPEELADDEPSQQLLTLLENQTPQATLTPQPEMLISDSEIETLHDAMLKVPDDLRRALTEATEHFDITIMLRMIEQIRLLRPELAEKLAQLAQNFEYAPILKILQ